MYYFGLKILALFYLLAGALFGELIRGIYLGKAIEWLSDRRGFLAAMALTNIIAITCLHFVRRRASILPSIEKVGQPKDVMFRGVPLNDRVALLLWIASWIIGLVLGIILSI